LGASWAVNPVMIDRRALGRDDSAASSPAFFQQAAAGVADDAALAAPRLRIRAKRETLSDRRPSAASPAVPLSWLEADESEEAVVVAPAANRTALRDWRAERQRATETPSPEAARSRRPSQPGSSSRREIASSAIPERSRSPRDRSRSPRRQARPAAVVKIRQPSRRDDVCTVCKETIDPNEPRYRGYLPQHADCGKVARAERDYMQSHPEVSELSQSVKSSHLSQASSVS
jgi:hypothetical protein